MTTINQLSTLGSLASSDKLIVYSNDNGDARKASLTTLLTFIESQFESPEFVTVITAPTASGFNIQMPTYTTNVWEIINPTGTFAAGMLTLPAPANCFDGQQVVVCTTQIITAFTLAGNGSTLVGNPTSLGAGGFFTMRFNALQSTWYCVSQNIVSTFTTLTLTGGLNDSNGNELLKVVATPSAINELTLTNAATGSAPSLTATGGDADVSLNLVPKGAGTVQVAGSVIFTNANVGAGVATFLNTPTSANLRAALTDETGTGAAVFNNAPTFIAPVLGDASATSITVPVVTITPTTVGGLGSAVTYANSRRTVTDSNATLTAGIGAVVAGGGANIVPVFSDGTNWRIG